MSTQCQSDLPKEVTSLLTRSRQEGQQDVEEAHTCSIKAELPSGMTTVTPLMMARRNLRALKLRREGLPKSEGKLS